MTPHTSSNDNGKKTLGNANDRVNKVFIHLMGDASLLWYAVEIYASCSPSLLPLRLAYNLVAFAFLTALVDTE